MICDRHVWSHSVLLANNLQGTVTLLFIVRNPKQYLDLNLFNFKTAIEQRNTKHGNHNNSFANGQSGRNIFLCHVWGSLIPQVNYIKWNNELLLKLTFHSWQIAHYPTPGCENEEIWAVVSKAVDTTGPNLHIGYNTLICITVAPERTCPWHSCHIWRLD